MDTPHDLALSKAKITLMGRIDSAFFTTIVFSLIHEWNDKIPTADTNGKVIRYNPKFFLSLSPAEQVFVLVHEAMHVAYMHMLRLMGRDPARWNCAADYVINLQLVDRGFQMPANCLLDRAYADMSAEQVYDLLPIPPKNPMPDLVYGSGDTDEKLTQDIQDILVRASVQSKLSGDRPGTIPGDIEIFLDKFLNPKLSWQRILQKYLNTFAKNDYSFKNPSRRFFPKYHMPSLHGVKLMDMVIAVDTSGSVSDHDFLVFISEVASIFRMMKPDNITLIQFDTAIKSVDKVKNINELSNLKFTGRGGTHVGQVFEWAEKNRPQLLMVFSDGEFSFSNITAPRGVETLWVIHNNKRFKPPFGKVIEYTI